MAVHGSIEVHRVGVVFVSPALLALLLAVLGVDALVVVALCAIFVLHKIGAVDAHPCLVLPHLGVLLKACGATPWPVAGAGLAEPLRALDALALGVCAIKQAAGLALAGCVAFLAVWRALHALGVCQRVAVDALGAGALVVAASARVGKVALGAGAALDVLRVVVIIRAVDAVGGGVLAGVA